MRHRFWSALFVLGFTALAPMVHAAETPKTIADGLKNPESVCLGPDGALYVTEIGESGKDCDCLVTVIKY